MGILSYGDAAHTERGDRVVVRGEERKKGVRVKGLEWKGL